MRETGRDRYWRQVRALADREDLPIPEARQRWREERAKKKAKSLKARAKRIVVALTATAASMLCPFCRDGFSDDPVHSCRSCSTRFHRECWGELQESCTTLGCVARKAIRRVIQPAAQTVPVMVPAAPPAASPTTHPTTTPAPEADGQCECCGTRDFMGPCPCALGECATHRSFGPCAFCRSMATRTRAGSDIGRHHWIDQDLCADCTRFITEDVERERRSFRLRVMAFVVLALIALIAGYMNWL